MTEGRAADSASRSACRSRRSTAAQAIESPGVGAAPPRCAHATTGPPPDTSRSTRWPPAKPVAPVMSGSPATGRSAVAGLFLVVPAERRIFVLDRPPPALVVAVPLHGLRETVFEPLAGLPAQRLELAGVERVAAIVALPVRDRLNQRDGLAGQLENAVGEVDVLDLVATPDVVDLSRNALVDQQIDTAAMVVDVKPVALVLPVAVERDRDVVDQVGDEERE